jgi:hypothetical protein
MHRYGLVVVIGIVVALGAQLSSQEKKGGVVVDKDAKTITIDAKIAPRKLANLDKIYPLEVIACWPTPKGKKAHETIVTIDEAVKPSEIHKALESLGLKAGTPVMGAAEPKEPKGPALNVYFLVNDPTGLPRKVSLDRAMVDAKNGKPFPKKLDNKEIEWRFTGSTMTIADAGKDQKIYGADFSGTFMAIFPVTSETVVQSSLTIEYEGVMKLEVNNKVMPKEGTPVKLVIEVKK